MDVSLLNPFGSHFNPTILTVTGALLVVATIGKVVSGYAAGSRHHQLNRLAIGIGMIPRGEVGLIFAHLGLDSGVIAAEGFNVIVLVVMLTTFLAPPLLKATFSRIPSPTALVEQGAT